MSFQWRKFLDLAEELAQKTEEEYTRSSVSRAYYALYNVLCVAAGQHNRGKKESHKILIETLKNLENDIDLKPAFEDLEDSEIRLIGNQLESLRNLRNDADYDGTKQISQTQAKEVCEKVRLIFDQLDNSD